MYGLKSSLLFRDVINHPNAITLLKIQLILKQKVDNTCKIGLISK